MKDPGDGIGFVAAAGEHVNFTLTDSNGAASMLNAAASTCDDAGANTNASGQCTIVFNSTTAGKVTGACVVDALGRRLGAVHRRDRRSVAPNSGDAVKTFVDANIQITPNGVNRVGEPHTFTAHVNVNTGDGNGFVNAPDGTRSASRSTPARAAFTTANPCTTAGGTGCCTITLELGRDRCHDRQRAHERSSVGGVSLTRHTNGAGANSGPGDEAWVEREDHDRAERDERGR